MKQITILLAALFIGSFSMAANKVTIDIPAGTKTLKVKAIGVPVDTCNAHGLFISDNSEDQDGQEFYLGVISTKMACFTTAFKYMDLYDEIIVEDQKEITFTFQAQSLPELKFEYK